MASRAAYDEDFYIWTQEQAALLRELPRAVALPNTLDLAHIAEEIEDMGKSELRRVGSNILQMLIHLIKLSAHGLHAPPSRHWVDHAPSPHHPLSRSAIVEPLRACRYL